MEMPKATDADKERFRTVVPGHPDVTIKPMFGNLGAFVNGNMFAGLFGSTIGVKLAEADKQELEGT
ncbi:MAG: TfoX/Sxy family protein, partial [Pseudarthrobacter sp.]